MLACSSSSVFSAGWRSHLELFFWLGEKSCQHNNRDISYQKGPFPKVGWILWLYKVCIICLLFNYLLTTKELQKPLVYIANYCGLSLWSWMVENFDGEMWNRFLTIWSYIRFHTHRNDMSRPFEWQKSSSKAAVKWGCIS